MANEKKIGIEEVSTEQVISGEATRNVLDKQLIRWAKRGDTTPSVLNVEKLQFRNTSPVTVVAFDDGKVGQSIEVYGDGQTTVANNAKIARATGITSLLPSGSVSTFTKLEDGVWHEHSGAGGGGGGGGVTSFAGRGGVVVPVATDYPPAFIGAIPTTEKAAASGVATLDGASKVPALQLGTGTADATTFLRGDKTWQVIAGGVAVSYWDDDAPVASPNALDVDWWNGATVWPAGWVDPTGSAFDVAAVDPVTKLFDVRGVFAGWRGKVFPMPAGDWSLTCKMRITAFQANYILGGLVLLNALGNLGAAGANKYNLTPGYNTTDAGWAVTAKRDDNAPVISGWVGPYPHGNWIILRIRKIALNYTFEWSTNGTSWLYATSALTFVPTYIGLQYYGGGMGVVGNSVVSFKYVRFSTVTTQDPVGVMRSIS